MKTILKFYSPTCGPCKAMSKNLEQIKDAIIMPVDITNVHNAHYIEDYNIRTVPTTIILGEDGGVQAEFKGVIPVDKIKEAL